MSCKNPSIQVRDVFYMNAQDAYIDLKERLDHTLGKEQPFLNMLSN